jgi:hypothetical protein
MQEAHMRNIGTKELGVTVLAVAMLQWACDSGGVSGPSSLPSSAPASSSAAPQSLAGTWRGGDTTLGMVWRLNQDGARISGSSQIFGEEWTAAGGSVVGTLSGSTLAFSETHTAGALSGTGCAAQLQGTLQLRSLPDRPQVPPGRYRQDQPDPPPTRDSLSGRITGQACDGPVDMTVALFRD